MRAGRRFPIGAEVLTAGGVDFRVWAPRRTRVDVVLDSGSTPLEREDSGYFSGTVAAAAAGMRYRFRLDGGDAFPDPASRFQPEGPHGPSEIVDPAFAWTDAAWRGLGLEGQVIYEMHIGTFTREGTWEAARRHLRDLKDLGVTVLEVMPVADFPGQFGWGYDGVTWFAPVAIYGRPDDFRRFVDDAHAAGLSVILDVVYNHIGPDGNYLKQYSEDYFTARYENEWGEAINFDGDHSAPVREWVASNTVYWISEYHLDGFRLDAAQQIFDSSPRHIIAELTESARSAAAGRRIIVVAEDERQRSMLAIPPENGGCGLDGMWNDDFHHSTMVAVTGRNEAYYSDFQGVPQELLSTVKHGYLFQGQRSRWQKQRRGSAALGKLRPWQFVNYVQNHDQVANSARGYRLHRLTSPGRYRALTAFLLLAPGTPMLFQGQEFAASSPFLFFADHKTELCDLVREGRKQFLAQFPSLLEFPVPDPCILPTFESCKLDWRERERNRAIYCMHEDLLKLRKQLHGATVDGAVLAEEAFVLRYSAGTGNEWLLLFNLGRDLWLDVSPEPLLAPPPERLWKLLWCSEDPDYDGGGIPRVFDTRGVWRIPGNAAVVMQAEFGDFGDPPAKSPHTIPKEQ